VAISYVLPGLRKEESGGEEGEEGSEAEEEEMEKKLGDDLAENYIYTYLQKVPVGLENVKTDLKLTNNLGRAYRVVSPLAAQENATLEFKVEEQEDLFVTVGL
jgi:hypothetical protein